LSLPVLHLLASKRWNKKIYRFYRLAQKPPCPQQSFSGLQASIGLEKLKTLDKRIVSRQTQAELFKSLLDAKVKPQHIEEGVVPNYYFFVALLPVNPRQVRRSLLKRGIDAGIGAEIADDCGNALASPDCPNAAEVFRRGLQLPLYEGLPEARIRYVAKALGEILNETSILLNNQDNYLNG
ncbi:MAG: DegT/DnrJ/EryC1/StrS family aminotransferase, partial [Candidatus Omnitrophica bacterium]|nr:DegT/DnrJ/EryC1/StrS family aminotransferase [Candidatus Omnitrophota bacterium]